jgi:hypothetical protein
MLVIKFTKNTGNSSTNEIENFNETTISLRFSEHTKINLKAALFYIPNSWRTIRKKIAIVSHYDYLRINTNFSKKFLNSKYINIEESENDVNNLARVLSQNNYKIDVWGKPSNEIIFDNLKYLDYKYLHGFLDSSNYYDVVIWWRHSDEIKNKFKESNLRKDILCMQDYVIPTFDITLTDSIVFLSENHKSGILENYFKDDIPLLEKISQIIPNSINIPKNNIIPKNINIPKNNIIPKNINIPNIFLDEIENKFSHKLKYKCVYLDNHAYGLDLLLEAWPKIKERFPLASLDVYYGTNTWGLRNVNDENFMRDKLYFLSSKDVSLKGEITDFHLNKKLLKAEFWLYPALYDEPYCKRGVQAVNAGVIPIVSDQPFLRELAVKECIFWPLDVDTFTKKCVEVMSLDISELNSIRELSINKAKLLLNNLDDVLLKFEKLF